MSKQASRAMIEGKLMRAVFVTNFCPHYRVGAFEDFAARQPTRFLFFSEGREWYWEKKNPIGQAAVDAISVAGMEILPGFRFSIPLLRELLFSEYDAVIKCTNGRLELPFTYICARVRRKKFILWQTMWYHPQTLFHQLSKVMLRHIWRKADAITVYGDHGKTFLTQEGVPGEKIFIAWQAVDNAMFGRVIPEAEKDRVREELEIRNKRIILYVGQLVPVKGVEYLLDAFKSMGRDDVALILIGSGPLEGELRSRAQGAPNVHFVGYVPPDQLPVYYSIARVSVLPSISLPHVKEAWGLVVNEAMNQGCPVVATDAVGAAVGGLLEDGRNGFVVPERDSAALAVALSRVVDEDSLHASMKAACLASIRQFTFERWSSGFESAIAYAFAPKMKT